MWSLPRDRWMVLNSEQQLKRSHRRNQPDRQSSIVPQGNVPLRRIRNLSGDLEAPVANEILVELHDPKRVATFRKRLSDPSWFMKAVRENTAVAFMST